MDYQRCPFCRQLVDPTNPDELAHHARQGHAPIAGIPDDGLETIPLDFAGVQRGALADIAPAPGAPPQAPKPYKNVRRGRRKKSSFEP